MVERIKEAEMVLYGYVRNITESGTGWERVLTYSLNVYCVLKKGNQDIKSYVTFKEVSPPNPCVNNPIGKNKRIIVMLTEWHGLHVHNVNHQPAAFEGSSSNLKEIADGCLTTGMYAPENANAQCPEVDNEKCERDSDNGESKQAPNDGESEQDPDNGTRLSYMIHLLVIPVTISLCAVVQF